MPNGTKEANVNPHRILYITVAILAGALLFSGCSLISNLLGANNTNTTATTTNDPLHPTATAIAQAETLAEAALTSMRAKDYSDAYSKFSQAILLDATNGKVVVGYSLLNLASMSADPTLVNVLQSNIGLVDYPATMSAALDPTNWIHPITNTSGSTTDSFGNPYGTFPNISGQQDTNGDGVIDISERSQALGKFIFTHNTGFDFIPKTLDSTLGARLDTAVQTIKNSATDSMQLTITWDMVMNQPPDQQTGAWPYKNGQPVAFVIGKAELLSIAAAIEEIHSILKLGQIYSLTLPLSSYWNYATNVTTTPPTTKPFDTLLQLNPDAATQLAAAKTSMQAALTDSIAATTLVQTNRPGFSISNDPVVGIFPVTTSTTTTTFNGVTTTNSTYLTWDQFTQGLRFQQRGAQEALGSLTTTSTAFFPTSSTFNIDTSPWPTSAVQGQSFGINLGVMFSTPLALIGSSGLLQLAPSGASNAGEPQFYKFATTGFFNPLSDPEIVSSLRRPLILPMTRQSPTPA